jgi:hypothetical protein
MRPIRHWKVTKNSAGARVILRLRKPFPYDAAPDGPIFGHGVNFNDDVVSKSLICFAPG